MPRRKRRLASRLRDYVRQFLAFLFSNVGVIVLVVAYTIAGAFMFQAIEGGSELERGNQMAQERDNTAQYLWQNVTLTLNLFNETELKKRISIELYQYQNKIVRAVRKGWDGARTSRQWSFSSAFLYSLTVITTIGYGHLSPRTGWGKVTTIFYALLGMPLFLLYLSNVGELLARWFKCLYALVCLCRGCPGFTRRRVARLRTIPVEISDPESIERPANWRSRNSDSDVTPDRNPRNYNEPRRPEYVRSTSMPQPCTRSSLIDPTLRGFSNGLDPRLRGLPETDPRLRWANGTDPRIRWHDGVESRTRWNDPRLRGFADRRDLRLRGLPDGIDPRFREFPDRIDQRFRGFAIDPRFRGWSDQEDQSISEFSYVTFDAQTITVPISVCIFILVGYVIFGSMIFGMWEKWDSLDGAYFCFISLSSIGFGDFVPGERIYAARIETSFIVCSMYLMLGMALVAMCFNLMQEQVMHYFASIKRALKRMCRCKR